MDRIKCPLCEDQVLGFGGPKGVVVHLYLHHDLRAPQIHELLMDEKRNGLGVAVDLGLDHDDWVWKVL